MTTPVATLCTAPPVGWSATNHGLALGTGLYPSWDEWTYAVAREVGHRICGARNRHQQPCRLYPGTNGRCRYHGGHSVSGIASGAWKHGRRSKVMPTDIREAMERAANDPQLLSLAEQLGMVEAKEDRLLERLAEVERDAGELSAEDVTSIIWEELKEWADHKRKLVDTEMKLRVAHHDMITRDRLGAVLHRIADALQGALVHVSDDGERQKVLSAFAAELRRFLEPS